MSELLDLAVGVAIAAGDLLLRRFAEPARGLESKSTATDLVSDADRDTEKLITGLLHSERPGDGIIGEEGAAFESETGINWVVDPLDGTVNFLYGIPHWAVSIAARDHTGTVVGVVHDPSRAETFTAVAGSQTRLNGKPVSVSKSDDLGQALVATGFAYDPRVRATQSDLVPELLRQVRDIRRAGAAALDLAWVACGRLDGYFESTMGEWDRIAGELLVKQAGGVTSELPTMYGVYDDGLIASGPGIHDSLCRLVRR